MNKEEAISLIKGRILDEYHKHPQLDWAEIAARKIYSQWSEYYTENAAVSGSLPTLEQSKKAMLRRKTKFVDNIDKFSSRKNAYKQGWQDCYNWIMSKGNDR